MVESLEALAQTVSDLESADRRCNKNVFMKGICKVIFPQTKTQENSKSIV